MIHNQTFAFVDLAVIKDQGNLSDINAINTYDNMLLFWAESVSRFINEFCHREFHCWEGAKYFNGAGSTLMLPCDLLSVSAFALDEDGSGNFATPVSATDYVLNPTYSYPKTYIKIAYNSSISSFATAIPNAVRITGVWGYGTGYSATPYTLSGDTVHDNPLSSTVTAITVSNIENFGAGMTIRIDAEQIYITGIYTNQLTVMRGVNGTMAAQHVLNAPISVYQYPSTIVGAALVQLSIWWKRRESAYASKTGNAVTGEYELWKGLDEAVRILLTSGNMKRHII